MVGSGESRVIVWTPPPGMLKLIVPPPIPLASLIACRREPPPLSLTFMTVKTAGVLGLCACHESCATGPFNSLALRSVRVVRDALAKVDTNRTEQTNRSVIGMVIRSANAFGSMFGFIVGVGAEGGGN